MTTYLERNGVQFVNADPGSKAAAKKYTYEWVHLPSGKSGLRSVWVGSGSIHRLIEAWNNAQPENWCFILLGLARNPRRVRGWTWAHAKARATRKRRVKPAR